MTKQKQRAIRNEVIMRCEDFPCCGHAQGECPTGKSKPCPECGRMFEPCSLGETYCLSCGQRPRISREDYEYQMEDGEES
jgi:hypothetical protein